MHVDQVIRASGYFLRRRDLLPLGFTDGHLRIALARGRIFRVRQGWYSVPDAPELGVRAVRVGGRLTGLSALESMGLPVPQDARLHVSVKRTASRLRSPDDRHLRLRTGAAVHWNGGGTSWRASIGEALLVVLRTSTRDIAVACCGAALRKRAITAAALDRVFADAPRRVRGWRALVSRLDESHGETFFRLWTRDAGLACEQQVAVPGVGRLDFRLAPHLWVEIDGGQHDPAWTGGTASSWESDLERDTAMTIRGDRVLRFGYRQLYTAWPTVLAAIERALSDDAALAARRLRHPYRPRAQRKRRRSAAQRPP